MKLTAEELAEIRAAHDARVRSEEMGPADALNVLEKMRRELVEELRTIQSFPSVSSRVYATNRIEQKLTAIALASDALRRA